MTAASAARRHSWLELTQVSGPFLTVPVAEQTWPSGLPAVDRDTRARIRAAIGELERVLGTRVRIMEKSKGKGMIELEYYSDEDLDRIYGLIVGTDATDPAML